MTDGDLLLRTILEQPDEDVPRLVYADWLDENGSGGDRKRAAFIRAQIRYARATSQAARHKAGRQVSDVLEGCVMLRTLPWTNEVMDVWRIGFHASGWGYSVLPSGCSVHFDRGFVSSLNMTVAAPSTMGLAAVVFEGNPVERISLEDGTWRVEIDPPGKGHGWQAYYFRRGEHDYLTMNGWETRGEVAVGIAADLKEILRYHAATPIPGNHA